jgi:hypothetical protein
LKHSSASLASALLAWLEIEVLGHDQATHDTRDKSDSDQ